MSEKVNTSENRIKSLEKAEYCDESDESQIVEEDKYNSDSELENKSFGTNSTNRRRDAETNTETDVMSICKLCEQYRQDLKDLRSYLATQVENNEFLKQKIKSLTEEVTRNEEEVSKLKEEMRLVAAKYDQLKLLDQDLKMMVKQANSERDEAMEKLIQSAEHLGAEKNEAFKRKAQVHNLKEKVELQKREIIDSKFGFTGTLFVVTAVALVGWSFFFYSTL